MPRFSRLALVSVVVLLIGGITNAAIQIGPVDGLWTTTYGKLILVKSGLVLVLIGFGAYHRRRLPSLNLRAAATELAVMGLVIAATSVLVGEPPAKAATAAASGPYATATAIGPYDLDLVVTPARVGSNAVHLYLLDRTGRDVTIDEVHLAATLPSAGIAALSFDGAPQVRGTTSSRVSGSRFPGTGASRIDVRKGDFNVYSTTVTVPIR